MKHIASRMFLGREKKPSEQPCLPHPSGGNANSRVGPSRDVFTLLSISFYLKERLVHAEAGL